MTELLNILLLDDEPIVGKRLKPALAKIGCDVEVFQDPIAAVARINQKEFDIIVTDIRMDEMDGMQVLEYVIARSPRTKVIMITGYAMIALAREAMDKGAFDFIASPTGVTLVTRSRIRGTKRVHDQRIYQHQILFFPFFLLCFATSCSAHFSNAPTQSKAALPKNSHLLAKSK